MYGGLVKCALRVRSCDYSTFCELQVGPLNCELLVTSYMWKKRVGTFNMQVATEPYE